MSVFKKIRSGRFKIILTVLPYLFAFILLKILFHNCNWEPFQLNLLPFFTTELTGIIFLLGFMLAGVLIDYKESEKIPGEMVASLSTIWQETEILSNNAKTDIAKDLQKKVCAFINMFKFEFLIKKEEKIFDLLDSFSENFMNMDKEVPPAFMARLRNEQTAIKKLLTRIKVKGSLQPRRTA